MFVITTLPSTTHLRCSYDSMIIVWHSLLTTLSEFIYSIPKLIPVFRHSFSKYIQYRHTFCYNVHLRGILIIAKSSYEVIIFFQLVLNYHYSLLLSVTFSFSLNDLIFSHSVSFGLLDMLMKGGYSCIIVVCLLKKFNVLFGIYFSSYVKHISILGIF